MSPDMPEAAAAARSPADNSATRSAPDTLPARGSVLGFDFGLARIGVASGELETGLASALTTLHAEANDERFAAIARLIGEWQPVALVVGIPTHLDGREHELTARCRRFANQLHGRHALPVFSVDERLSSVQYVKFATGGQVPVALLADHPDYQAETVLGETPASRAIS